MQKLQLSIPEPCHENWQNMTPTDQGRFCNACAKEVVDFSTMTDIQVLNYFTGITHDKVCGRALPEQLDRTISRQAQPKKRLFWYWNYVAMFFMFFAKGSATKAQGAIKPVTEMSPVKPNDIRGLMAVDANRELSRPFNGKVRDTNGNPVSFATIKLKGSNIGLSADANGSYFIQVKNNTTLKITASGYKPAEIVVGTQSFINTVLEKSPVLLKEVTVTEAGIIRRRPIEDKSILTDNKKIGEILLKPLLTKRDSAIAFSVKSIDTTKIKGLNITANNMASSNADTRIRMGGVSSMNANNEPLLIVDNFPVPLSQFSSVNPNDVENMEVLKGVKATALYGSAALYGAIIVTTKKLKVKNLDTVTVTAYPIQGKMIRTVCTSSTTTVMGGMTKGVTIKSTIADSLIMVANKITGAIKVYPNPAKRGEEFNISLKLKQAGLFQIQITDVTGRIVLQKQIIALAKEHVEKISGG